MGFQVHSFKRTRTKKRRMNRVSNRSLSSVYLRELLPSSPFKPSSSSTDMVAQPTAFEDQITANACIENGMENFTTLLTKCPQENVFLPQQESRAEAEVSVVEYRKPAMEMQGDLEAVILNQMSQDLSQLPLGSQNEIKDAEANDPMSIIPTYRALDDNLKEAHEKDFQNDTAEANLLIGLEYHVSHPQTLDTLSGLPQTTLNVELGFDAIFRPEEIVEEDIEMKDSGEQIQEVGINKHAFGTEVEEKFTESGENAQPGALVDFGKNISNVKMPEVAEDDSEIQEGFEDSEDGKTSVSSSLHLHGSSEPLAHSSDQPITSSIPNKFNSEMMAHWKIRNNVLQCFKKMTEVEIKLCPSQCAHLMETYLKCESFLSMHPREYLDVDHGDDPKTIQLLQSFMRASMELSKIMRHGALLIWNCASNEWLRNALTMVTNAPKPKHPDWKAVSPFSFNLEKFQWILHVISIAIKSVRSLNGPHLVDMDQDLCTVTLLDSYEELEAKDREILLQHLCFMEKYHCTRQEDGIDLAKFLVSKLQRQAAVEDNLCQSTGLYMDAMPEKIKTIGVGNCGTVVCEGDWLGITVAIKEVHNVKAFKLEEEFVDLQHPHIVRVFDHGVISRKGCIVMELMRLGDLFSFIEANSSEEPSFKEQDLDLIMQVAEALRYLNTNGVLHRDLKSKNIMLQPCQCGKVNCVIAKLGDFGISKYKGGESRFTTKLKGTQGYMAPEMMSNNTKAKYTKAVDVFSFAITCSEILSKAYPYEGILKFRDLREQTLAGQRPNLPEDTPLLLSAYIKRCWASNPSDRPKDFHLVCEFLRYFKEVSLRGGILYSGFLPEVRKRDAKMLLKHLGLPWCLERDGSTGKLSHIPEDLYAYIIDVAMKDKSWAGSLSDEEEVSNIYLEIANYYGNWASLGRDYKAAYETLQFLRSEGKCGEAIWRLGYCYELGLGVDQNFEEAAKLYIEAVNEADYAYALIDLGLCYILGRGVPQSIQKGSMYWDAAFNCQPLPIHTVIEQFAILRRDESKLLTTSKLQRKEAARRLLNLTLVSSGRKILSKVLDDEVSSLLLDDQLWSKNSKSGSHRTEELRNELHCLGEEIGEEEHANDIDNERSGEEVMILKEIFVHLRSGGESTVGTSTLNSGKVAEENDTYNSLLFPSNLDSGKKLPNFRFYTFLFSFLMWFSFSVFNPWFYIFSLLPPSRLLIIFASFSSIYTLRLIYNYAFKLFYKN